ncbi:MAG: peptidylprolyl isomerase [Deltaproteobacteria bacterium]|nr:peptidylprolyl isomerase [Deltaproteobacteria bacterium]
MVRVIRALLFAALLASAGTAQAQPAAADGRRLSVDRVVAVINDAIILESELNRRVAPLAFDLRRIKDERERERRSGKLKSQQLDEMINEELIVQAAEAAKIKVNPKQVQAAFDEIKNQNQFDDARLAGELRKQGYTIAGYRRDVRRQLLRLTAVNQLVRPRVSISDEDVKARYDEANRRSSAVSKVRLAHILLQLPERPTEAQLAKAKSKAAKIIEMANAGTPFAELAKKFSQDVGTRNAGGDLGWIERNSLDTEWEVIVFAMDKGEVRGPINGPQGLHVFHVADIEKSAQKPFEEVKGKIRNQLFRSEMDRQSRMWLEELRKKAHIDIKL